MPIRIYDIAKKLGVENRIVLAKARALGITAARVAFSSLDTITAEYLEQQVRAGLTTVRSRGLHSLSLVNFKAFGESQGIPVQPLTLIFGANSSGKSSIIHGLLLARHILDTGEMDASRTDIGGDSVDLGGFRQYVHRREANRRVTWSVELDTLLLRTQAYRGAKQAGIAKLSFSIGVPLDNFGEPTPDEGPQVLAYQLDVGHRTIIRLSRRPDGTLQVDRIDEASLQPVMDAMLASLTTTGKINVAEDASVVAKVVADLIPTLRFSVKKGLPEALLGGESSSLTAPQLIPISKANRQEQLAGAARLFIPRAVVELVEDLNFALRAQMERVRYLGPLRSFPPRHLAFLEDRGANWLAGGGYAWDLVRRDGKLREKVNRWLGSDRLQTRYELSVERLFRRSDAAAGIASGLGSIAADMEQKRKGASQEDYHFPFDNLWDSDQYTQWLLEEIRKKSANNPVDELVLMDRRTNTAVTHRDVGIGISQVLPVLVHAYADQGQIVAIEQPEIHLHPALQAELGDLFIESALGPQRNTFLLETHSEHVILRILRRVRETTEGKLPAGATPVRPEDVSVIFVEPTAQGSIVRHLPVTPDGDFAVPWPGGFFAERLADLP